MTAKLSVEEKRWKNRRPELLSGRVSVTAYGARTPGCLFKWAPWNSWLMQRPDSDEWVDLVILTAVSDPKTPFEVVGPLT